jgi:galactose dehydrogenase
MLNTATFHDLRGQSVFITGGGNGIGAALTEGFLEQGAQVAFVGRKDATAFSDEMAEKYGAKPLYIPCDITDIPALHAAMDRAAAAHGPITTLVNNAANDTRYAAGDVTESIWDDMQAVNLKAYFFACQKAAQMMKQTGGSIINFSSISYMLGIANLSTYIAANAGIMGLTRSLAREFGPDKIRVNALAPGWVLTQRQLDLWADPASLAAFMEKQCLREHIAPVDIVGGVLFLASGLSRMMTGQTLVIDAGVVGTG